MVFFIDCFAWNCVFGFVVCRKHYSKNYMKTIGKYRDKEINPF